ncbi:hypothetical protein [Ktedonosporobacter rubrisoli]|uniref:hypothetical protein n=1 Tax=Ktedonosporobacter rubrisoli TaxID=2509675 RepID=UPI0013EE4C28|nr:hypothetical protein [Ktedonosporobacter rubrisoli]
MDLTMNLELLEQKQEEQLFDLDIKITELMKVMPDKPEIPTAFCRSRLIECE